MKANGYLKAFAVLTLAALLPRVDSHSSAALTASGFAPSEAGPRIAWTTPTANELGNFTIVSAASDATSQYVSFAFANGTLMGDTQTVIDCYVFDSGEVALGTSKNTGRVNTNDPASLGQVQRPTSRREAGVLTCSFSMRFPPNLNVYAILATGSMKAAANASVPTKEYHGRDGHHVSSSTISHALPSLSATTSTSSLAPNLSTPRSVATSQIMVISWWLCGLSLLVGAANVISL